MSACARDRSKGCSCKCRRPMIAQHQLFLTTHGLAIGCLDFLTMGADVIRLAFRLIVAVVESFRGSEAQWPLLRNKLDNIGKDLKEGMLIFAFWVAPLLLIAAFMETFVTGTLLYLLFAPLDARA